MPACPTITNHRITPDMAAGGFTFLLLALVNDIAATPSVAVPVPIAIGLGMLLLFNAVMLPNGSHSAMAATPRRWASTSGA